MKFVQLMPSLEHLALAEIAITLLNQEDVGQSIWSLRTSISEKVSKLSLPKTLDLKLLRCIKAIHRNMQSWIYFHKSSIPKWPVVFYWTPQRAVDGTRTAKALVKDDTLDVHQRFDLACNYCFEDDIRYLWETFGLRKDGYKTYPFYNLPLVIFWRFYVDEEYDQFAMIINEPDLTAYQYGFRESAKSGNEAATRYFFQKLNPEAESDFIAKTAEEVALKISSANIGPNGYTHPKVSEVLLFLLSTMNCEKQRDIFSRYPYAVLSCLLLWPWQSLFLETAQTKWNNLSKKEYEQLLYLHFYSSNYIPEIFQEIMQKSPEIYKQCLTDVNRIVHLLTMLCWEKDEKNVQLILKDLSIQTRRDLVLGPRSQLFFINLVRFEMWDSVKFLIDECASSATELSWFENGFKLYVNEFDREGKKLGTFFQILEDCKEKYTEHNTASCQ